MRLPHRESWLLYRSCVHHVHDIFKTCDTITMISCTCLREEIGYCINKFTHIKLILLLVQNAGEVIPQLKRLVIKGDK